MKTHDCVNELDHYYRLLGTWGQTITWTNDEPVSINFSIFIFLSKYSDVHS